jgi:hypothetical protein
MAPSPSATATIIVHLLLKHRPGTRNPTVRRTLWRVVSLSSCGVALTIQCSPQSRSVVREAPRMCELAESARSRVRAPAGQEFYLLREAAAPVLRRQVRCARVPEAGSCAGLPLGTCVSSPEMLSRVAFDGFSGSACSAFGRLRSSCSWKRKTRALDRCSSSATLSHRILYEQIVLVICNLPALQPARRARQAVNCEILTQLIFLTSP